jgi:hypothetical protein
VQIDDANGREWNFNYSGARRVGKLTRMNTTFCMNSQSHWSRVLVVIGSIAMLVGAVDPMEGSLVILPGSGLVALGTFLGQGDRRLISFRVWSFILIAIGVGALWGLSTGGGLGGNSGRSMWWGLLILPYLIGWCVGIWGPGSPRWVLMLGVLVGLWYLAISGMVLKGSGRPGGDMGLAPIIAIGTMGVLTIGGCIGRLTKRTAE